MNNQGLTAEIVISLDVLDTDWRNINMLKGAGERSRSEGELPRVQSTQVVLHYRHCKIDVMDW